MKIKLHRFFLILFLFIQALSAPLFAQIIANFSASPPTGCSPLTVNFTDLSTGSPTSWSWNLGNGNTSTLKNPSAVYSSPGTYTITLVVSGSTKTGKITVLPKPTANFTTSAMPSCVGKTITFTDSSVPGGGPITSWAWDFGDGNVQTTSTGTVIHSYTSGGTFPVSVIITDVNGCSSSTVKSVTVLATPKAAFSGTPLFSCTAPLTVIFTNSSTTSGTVSYLWRFGDGTPNSTLTNPTHTYTALGTYKVTLIVTQGACIDSIVKTNYVVLQNLVANFSADKTSACVGSTITFTDTSVPLSTTRTWDFGDASSGVNNTSILANPTHTYNTPGTYTVSLLNATTSGCSDSEIKVTYITIHPLPVVAFTADKTQSCSAPFTVNFTDNSTNATNWLWKFGDGSTSTSKNPTHTYTSPGTNSVTLIVTSANGCVDSLVKPNYIFISPPIANFTATPREGCIPLNVNFTNTSISLVDPVVSYNWDFGNGTTTTASPTISHLYPAAGFYTVRLIITTAAGCKDTVIKNNYIKAGTPPVANFNVVDSTVCYGIMSQYNNLSTGADSAFWLWGDGSTMPMVLPAVNPAQHLYADTGLFTVTLIVYNKGCADTLVQPDIERIFPPKPVFTFKLNCINPYSVSFTDASIGADSLTWDFGDGTPIVSDSLTPTHIYATRGTKTVTLTAFNFTTGCSFAVPVSFTIADPVAQFTSTPGIGCYPLPVTFGNTSQDASITTWHFADGSLDTIANTPTVHTYVLPGKYPVKIVIVDINGCTDSITKNVIVQGAIPDFKADTTTGCAPLPIIFTDKSVSDSTIVQWKWTFGDLNTQTTTASPVNHTYILPGSYTVKMVVTDKNGCMDSISKINYILPTFPVPKFVTLADTFACRNELLTFNASTTNVAAPATYKWRYGDGAGTAPLSVNTTTHAYTSDNTYTVTLIVTDKNGCVDSIKHLVFVQHPNADFKDSTWKEDCGFREIHFTDKSTGVGITKWKWDFGDGATSLIQNPSHVYTVAGVYSVSLVVTNSAGCTDTVNYPNLIVVPGPVGTFTFTPKTGCNPLTVIFTAISTNTNEYIWDFGDGTQPVVTTVPTTQHTYTTTGTKTPILLLGNVLSNGSPCRLAATNLTGSVIVTSIIGVNIDSVLVKVKEGDYFVINSKITNTILPTYSWDPAYNLNCTNCQVPSVLGDGSGKIITYHLTVTDQNGCMDYDSIRIYYLLCGDDISIPNVFTPNDDGINDAFDIGGPCLAQKYLLRIYDRWGIQLFTSEEKNLSWDGRTTSGQPAPDGVYYYILTLDEKSYAGFLQLIRSVK